jgi:cobalt-zinc-cadmium efflux system membrane fusion protein
MRIAVIGAVIVVVLGVGAWALVGPRSPAKEASPTAVGATKDKAEGAHVGEAHKEGEAEAIRLSSEQRAALGVRVEPVVMRVAEAQIAVTGTIVSNPDRTVVVASRTPGRIVKVTARLGDRVEAGATLALLNSTEAAELLADAQQAESSLALAQAQADRERTLYHAKMQMLETAARQPTAEAAVRELQKLELGRAKQEYISALAKLELAEADHERAKRLVEGKIGARKDLVRAEKELFVARSELEAVAETIRLDARQQRLAADTALAQARSQRDKIRQKLRLIGVTDVEAAASDDAAHGRLVPLRAPFAGTVIERQASEGQLVDPGATPFRLADLSVVWALLDVLETDIHSIARGQEATVVAGRDTHTGRVTHIADVLDDSTRTVKLRVEIPNKEGHFKPGMFVTAKISTRAAGPARLMVPKNALLLLDDSQVVFVESEDGIRARPVEAGAEVGGWVPIDKGLQPGERVVTQGAFALKAQLVKAKLGEGH